MGRVPAVIYGDKQDTLMITLEPRELERELLKPGFFTHLYDVKINGSAHRVLPRDVQLDRSRIGRCMSTSCASAPAARSASTCR
ncbi:MAG: hypothetical protein WDO24_00730 [Pseudomonadota bacterium]